MDWPVAGALAFTFTVTLIYVGAQDGSTPPVPPFSGPVAENRAPPSPDIGMPDWLYPIGQALSPSATPDMVKHVPNSAKSYRDSQIDDAFDPPDWFPGEHPAMPAIIARGRAPSVLACALCHLPTGQGHPESATIAGLSAAYLTEQMTAFKNDSRGSVSASIMNAIAKAISDDEVQQAASYFASLKPQIANRIVEATTVPKSFVSPGGMRLAVKGSDAGTEPLGARIIVLPEDENLALSRDPHSGFVYYVPPNSLDRGEKLVKTGANKTTACGTCHGADLKGTDLGPPLAGHSPVYIIRQLNDIQSGRRTGSKTEFMRPIVGNLKLEDMISIGAYLGAQRP